VSTDSLWHKVIRSKYGVHVNSRDSEVVTRGNGWAPWKSISRIYPVWFRFIFVRVGNGELAKFWEDVWVGTSSFAVSFPYLYRISQSHNCSITSMACLSLAPISWNFNFPRNLNDREVGELIGLLSRLEHVSLVLSLEDKWVCAIHSLGSFSCTTFLDELIDKPRIRLFPFHKKIWRACVSFKVKVFLWILVHRGTLTNDALQKRRPSCSLNPQWCIMCRRRNGESLDHLFMHCSVAANLWPRLFCLGNVMWVASKDSAQMILIDFQVLGMSKRAKVRVIWLGRSGRVFEDVSRDIDFLWEKVRHLVSFWISGSPLFKGVPLLFFLLQQIRCHFVICSAGFVLVLIFFHFVFSLLVFSLVPFF